MLQFRMTGTFYQLVQEIWTWQEELLRIPLGMNLYLISHSLEDPRSGLSYGEVRKVKVSQVKEFESIMSVTKALIFCWVIVIKIAFKGP